MYKKITTILLMIGLLLMFNACGTKKLLHCDQCGKEVLVAETSNMEEEWLIFCAECGDIEYQ